jgi:hypothetical protein
MSRCEAAKTEVDGKLYDKIFKTEQELIDNCGFDIYLS